MASPENLTTLTLIYISIRIALFLEKKKNILIKIYTDTLSSHREGAFANLLLEK